MNKHIYSGHRGIFVRVMISFCIEGSLIYLKHLLTCMRERVALKTKGCGLSDERYANTS